MTKAQPGLWPGELKNEIKKVKLLFFTLLGFYIFLPSDEKSSPWPLAR